jgi:hypothetical protein
VSASCSLAWTTAFVDACSCALQVSYSCRVDNVGGRFCRRAECREGSRGTSDQPIEIKSTADHYIQQNVDPRRLVN